jgi:hypothetical protein
LKLRRLLIRAVKNVIIGLAYPAWHHFYLVTATNGRDYKVNHVGHSCDNAGLAIETDADIHRTQPALKEVGDLDADDLHSTLANVENMVREKLDWALPESLLIKSFASISLNISTAIVFFCTESDFY